MKKWLHYLWGWFWYLALRRVAATVRLPLHRRNPLWRNRELRSRRLPATETSESIYQKTHCPLIWKSEPESGKTLVVYFSATEIQRRPQIT